MGFVGQFSQVLDLQRLWRQDDLFEQDTQGGVVITIAGVVEEHEEGLVGKKSGGNVLFRISETPPGKAFLDLMNRMMGQRSDVSGESGQRLYANTMGGEIFIMPALEVRLLMNVLTVRIRPYCTRSLR
jgi:septum formation inhibitor-activating ATPase MinD